MNYPPMNYFAKRNNSYSVIAFWLVCVSCMGQDLCVAEGAETSGFSGSLQPRSDSLSSEVLIVGRMAELDKEISSVYFLLEGKLGALKVYQAEKMFLGRNINEGAGGYRYYLTSVFYKKDLVPQQTVVHSSFLVFAGEGTNAWKEILPVQRVSIWDLQAQSRDMKSYVEYNDQLHKDLSERMLKLNEVKQESDTIAGRVSDTPTVRQAADLKREVGALSFAQDDLELRLKMLHGMILGSEKGATDEELENRQAELSEQLKDVAQLTARADRLNRLKKMAYANTVKRKKSVIEEFGGVDPEDLQRELVELRQRRVRLEEKLSTITKPHGDEAGGDVRASKQNSDDE